MNDIGVIHLRGKRGGFTIVDADLFDELNKTKWYMGKNGYPFRSVYSPTTQKSTPVTLHSVIHKVPKGFEVDHENGFKIDNTRRNLRTANRGQSMANCTASHKNKSSKFKGVRWRHDARGKKGGAWIAQIRVDYKRAYLGTFDSEIEAAEAYNAEAKKRFGPFAKLNDFGVASLSLSGVAGRHRQILNHA